MQGLTVQDLAIRDLRAHEGLLRAHALELEDPAPDVQWDTFLGLEASGSLLSMGLYQGGILVGYCVSILSFGLTNAASYQCVCSAIYVQPEARAHGGGALLMRAVEQRARTEGVDEVYWHARPGSQLDLVLSEGYVEVETTYKRRL